MDKKMIAQLSMYRRDLLKMVKLINNTFNFDVKIKQPRYLSEIENILNGITLETRLHITIYFYKKCSNDKENEYKTTIDDYDNKIKFVCKDGDVSFVDNKLVDEMYVNSKNVPVFKHKNAYYDYKTGDVISLKYAYSINIHDNDNLTDKMQQNKESMCKIKNILNKYEIDEDIVDRAKYEPGNVMVSILGHMFKNYKRNNWNEELEDDYIEKCYCGASLYYKIGKMDGEHTQYDINGYYLHLLKSLIIPTGDAEEISEDYAFNNEHVGIYKLRLDSKLPCYYSDKKNIFTSYDLYLFDKIGVKYEILSGVIYKTFIRCKDIKNLSDLLDDLYINRDSTLKEAFKKWGGVMSKKNTEKTDKIYDGDIIVSQDKNKEKYEVVKACFKYKYKTKLFRIKHFLVSYGRLILGNKIHQIEKMGYDVVRVQTDSIVTNAPPEIFNIGVELGKWKIEKKYKNFQNINIENYGEF